MKDETYSGSVPEGKKTIAHTRQDRLALKPATLPSSIGFNLSEFSLSPLAQKTKHLANSTLRHEWNINVSDGKKPCFFEVTYGSVAPNSDSEDILMVLTHLANEAENPLSVRTSFYQIHQLCGHRHRASAQQIGQYVRHLDALYGMDVKTNFVYDREIKDWKTVRTRVLAGYSYNDQHGVIRKRRFRVRSTDENEETVEILVEKPIKELYEFNFTDLFYRHFIQDSVPIDLGVYFSLGVQTAKRLFKFGNKYIHSYGSHSLDLQLFCMSRIGMSPTYVERYAPSKLASQLRPYARRVTETEHMRVSVEKSPSSPCGYKIIFEPYGKQLPLPSLSTGFTKAEEKAFSALTKHGIYPNISRDIIIATRKAMGRQAPEYINFVLRKFSREWVSAGKLKVPKDKTPGVLKTFFDNNWYYPQFMERQSEKRRQEQSAERKRFPNSPTPISTILGESNIKGVDVKSLSSNSNEFSLSEFKSSSPEVYKRIVKAVKSQYNSVGKNDLKLSKNELEKIIDRAVNIYCEQTFKHILNGDVNYFPSGLVG